MRQHFSSLILSKLRGKLQTAEEAITKRFQELEFEKDNQEELRLLSDGLSIIRDVKEDRLGILDDVR